MEPVIGKRCLTTIGGSSVGVVSPFDRPANEPAAWATTKPAGGTRTSSASEQGSGRLLDALTIALAQATKGTWYVSTLELQLASFLVCVACRGVRTLRVTVDNNMPLSLWGDDDPWDYSLESPKLRRLPALRAAGVAWIIPAAMLVALLTEAPLVRDVEWMQVTGYEREASRQNATYSSTCEALAQYGTRHSPRSYFESLLPFFGRENVAIAFASGTCVVAWPSALRQLSVAYINYQPVDWVELPSSLERLALGGCFHEPIKYVSWPVSLKHLTLGGWFNQPIADVVWPVFLMQLTFGDMFNQPIADVVWPASFTQLTFGKWFDQPIIDVAWPSSLTELTFGEAFDQPITDVAWSVSLLRLAFGDNFDQSIAEVVWPIALESLMFGKRFDQPVEGVVWPVSLRWLTFNETFAKRTEAIVWPPSLEPLIFRDTSWQQDDGYGSPPGRDLFDKPNMLKM